MILPPCQSLCVMRLYKKGQAIYYHQSVCLCLEQSLTVQLSCRTRETTESFESLVFSVWLLVPWWMLSDLKYLVDFWWICSQPPLLFLSPGRCASCGENVVGEGTGCTAMDQVFHVDCFVCMTCSTKLRGKPFFAVEKKAYCEPCYIVSNFFLSLLFTCLAFWFWLSLVICIVSKGHFKISGMVTLVPGMVTHFHFRRPHFISSSPDELPLTTHIFISSFSVPLFCFWSPNEIVSVFLYLKVASCM